MERHLNQETQFASILDLFLCLLAGQILRHVSNTTKIPYTPLLVILGITAGAFAENLSTVGEGLKDLSSLHPVSSINQQLILLIFIPSLIFESAFNTDWHIFKVEFLQVLLLAGPCLVAASFLTALVMRYILGYDGDFTWSAAVLFGSLISATDPVAVVSLLKELGASRRLSTLIEGESLLNDGTAMVMFNVVLNIVKGEERSPTQIVVYFCRLSFGGPILGIIFGVIMSTWLKRIYNNPVLETNITVFGCYLLFYVAENTSLHVSGILAMVALGLYMTKSGKTRISSLSEVAMHSIWSYIGYVAETIIFLLTGIILGEKILFNENSSIVGKDWWLCIVLYIFLHLIRFLMVFICYPVLKKMGYGITIKHAIVIGYGGLRGAIGLTLALIVGEDENIDPRIKDVILFHTAGIAFLTLLINGTTTGPLIKRLGLSRLSEVKKKIMKNVLKQFENNVDNQIDELRQKDHFNLVEWPRVVETIGFKKLKEFYEKRSNINLAESLRKVHKIDQLKPEEQIQETRHRFLTILKGTYWHFYEEGFCTSETLLLLIESIDRGLDHDTDEIKDWDFIKQYFTSGKVVGMLGKLRKIPLLGYFFKKQLFSKLSFTYDVIINFLEAHEAARGLVAETITQEEYLDMIVIESKNNEGGAQIFLNKFIESNFDEIIKSVQHRRASYYVLHHQFELIDNQVKMGQIEEKEANILTSHVNQRAKKLYLQQPEFKIPNPEILVYTHSFFRKIFNLDEINSILRFQEEKMFSAGDTLLKYNQKDPQFVYFISKGIVAEKSLNYDEVGGEIRKVKYHSGDFVGLQYIVGPNEVTAEVYCVTTVTALRIPLCEVEFYLYKNDLARQLIWRRVAPIMIYTQPEEFHRFHESTIEQISHLIAISTFRIYKEHEHFYLKNGGIILKGVALKIKDQISEEEDENDESVPGKNITEDNLLTKNADKELLSLDQTHNILVAPIFIYPNQQEVVAQDEVVVFELPEQLKKVWLLKEGNVLEDILEHGIENSEIGGTQHKQGGLFGTKQQKCRRGQTGSSKGSQSSILQNKRFQAMLAQQQQQWGTHKIQHNLPQQESRNAVPTGQDLAKLQVLRANSGRIEDHLNEEENDIQ